MKPIKMLDRILRRRETILDEKRAILSKIHSVDTVIAQDKESCSLSELFLCGAQCDVLKAKSIRQDEVILILDLPLLPQMIAKEVACDEPYDDENKLQGPTLSEAIKRYRGVREGTALEIMEFDRRYHFLFHLEAQGFLPLRYDYTNANSHKQSLLMPLRLYLKRHVPNILREITMVPNRKQSTIKDDLHRFKVFVNLMSQMAGEKEYDFSKEFGFPPSKIGRMRKVSILHSEEMANCFAKLEQEALEDNTVNQSKIRDLLIFRLLFYSGAEINIRELLDLNVSQIGFKRRVIHFSQRIIHYPADLMKLLKAYVGSKRGRVFVGNNENAVDKTWLNKKLSRIIQELGIKGKILPCSIQKSLFFIQRTTFRFILPHDADTVSKTATNDR